MSSQQSNKQARRPRMTLSPFSTNILQVRDPFVLMWWSAALPGFGHLMVGTFMQGFILVGWEFYANINAHLNEAILFSMLGRFDQAKQIVDMQWLMIYISVYVFCIWDAYSRCHDLNKVTLLAIRESAPIETMKFGTLSVSGLRPVSYWKTVFLNLFLPGLAQLYMQRLITGIVAIVWWLISGYFSHFTLAAYYTLLGDFQSAKTVVDYNWLLFLPSLYCFALYDGITSAAAINRLFETEQAEYLEKQYQINNFHMPI